MPEPSTHNPSAARPQALEALLHRPAGADPLPGVAGQVVTCDGQDIILIGVNPGADVDRTKVAALTQAGMFTEHDRWTIAAAVTDSDRREHALRRAVTRLAARHREVLRAQARTDCDHLDELLRIRHYVIDWCKQETLGRGDLDDFLTRFDLPQWQPVRVHYTITGSYLVSRSIDQARRDAANLRPDLTHLNQVEDGSDHHTVTVDHITDDTNTDDNVTTADLPDLHHRPDG